MDRVRSGIRAMKSCFFVHSQAEGKSAEIFETNCNSENEITVSEEKAQNEVLLEDQVIS